MTDAKTTEVLWGDFIIGPSNATTLLPFQFEAGSLKGHVVTLAPTRTGMSFIKAAKEKSDD